MTALALHIALPICLAQLLLPLRLAWLPLVLATAWTTNGLAIEIAGGNFTLTRVLVAVGVLRVLLRGESMAGGMNAIDRWMFAWAAWLVASAVFHVEGTLVYRAGIAWSDLGVYFLLRVFLRDAQDVRRLFVALCLALLPVALLMGVEARTGHNAFGAMGGVLETAAMRGGHYRASGPFAHAILAGAVGAVCLPMAVALWRRHRVVALIGLFDALAIIYFSRSSGPVLVAAAIVLALLLWRHRAHLRALRWSVVAGCVALQAVMNDPFYFVIARIDITGGSQGWHRAQLIRSSIRHLDEWWLTGTDYTRHWMASGIHANAHHADITNHLLAMGVMGGLPLMAMFTMVLVSGFRGVGWAVGTSQASGDMDTAWLAWVLGATLFGHAVNFSGVSLFDQSAFFLYAGLASIAAAGLAVAGPVPAGAAARGGWEPLSHASEVRVTGR